MTRRRPGGRPRGHWRARCTHPVALALLLSSAPLGLAQSLDWQPVPEPDETALADAISVGHEDQFPLYACRAPSGGGTQAGRYRPDFDGCHIGFSGQEISVKPFEVLAAAWQDGRGGSIPPDSLASGQRVMASADSRFVLAPLYSCRASYLTGVQAGEVAAGDRGCRFGFGGRQVTVQKYQVLWDAPWMTWVPGTISQLPQDAVVGGSEGGERFYICRGSDATGVHPGKIKQSSPGCAFASDGAEVVTRRFSVLVPRWVAGNAGTLPVSALPVGVEKQDPLYLCRSQARDSMQIGKMMERFAACHIGMMGKEGTSASYEILSGR